MFDKVLFHDHFGSLNSRALVGAILLVEMFDQNTTRSRGVQRQRTMGDMTLLMLESVNFQEYRQAFIRTYGTADR
jgi:hypothetical protein